MKNFYLPLVLFPLLFILSCSASDNSGPEDVYAIETCYDVIIVNAGVRQTKNICTTEENGGYNGLGTVRFIKLSVNAQAAVSVQVVRTSGLTRSDPDIYIYKNGKTIAFSEKVNLNTEFLSTALMAGNYVIGISEYRYSFDIDAFKFNSNSVVTQKNTSSVQLQNVDTGISNCVAGSNSNVSGQITFERVNHLGTSLDYSNISVLPVQQVVVQVICNGGVYSSISTDTNGMYRLSFPDNQSVYVRVKAQMLNGTTWDFSVVDNTVSTKPVYAMDSRSFIAATDQLLNLNAPTGWGGSRYVSTRVAAPFAILDSIRKAKDKILSVANVNFPPLVINWSVNNSTDTLIGSYYDGTEIYLLGKENNDTDEYDEHVIIHEWAHYFEDKFSRSDSIGGSHGKGDVLDIRVAFGEGFGNAFSAMVTDDAFYIDTLGFGQGRGFYLDMEENNCVNPGWYSECSIQSVLYDIYDSDNENLDSLNLGLTSIYNVLIDAQKNTDAMTSMFSFIKPLKDQNPVSANAIDLLLSAQSIDPIGDIYGGEQTSLNPGETNQLPIYLSF